MSTVVNFHGKNYIEPGAYAVSVYSPTSVENVAQFGNVMIIDTGLSKDSNDYEFSGGAGIQGELVNGLQSVYEFNSYEDFLNFVGGGLIGDIAAKIFTPREGVAGAPKLYYCRAAKTTCATITLTIGTNTLVFKCKNEGVVGNGVEVGGSLKLGYSAKIVAGIDDPTKFKLQIFKGTYQGIDDSGEIFGTKTIDDSTPDLIVESGEFSTFNDLYNWCILDKYVKNNFVVSKTGTDNSDLVVVTETLATGGTTDYSSAGAYDDVLENISELDITTFLCTNTTVAAGTDASTNGKLFTFLKQNAKFTEFMVVPGGSDEDDLFGASDTSQAIAKYYDSEQVIVVHGSPQIVRKDGNGTKYLNPIYFAATVCGMVGGGQAQTPLTFKKTGYSAFKYNLKKKERENALQAGILHTRNVNGYWVINQGITTLQDNKRTIADDGQSMEFSIALIKAQLNKEIILDAESRFVGDDAATASVATVKNFVETKLQSLTATSDTDNLIISWKNVKTTASDGDYYTTYDFVPNVPVNKLFFTGNIVDFTA